MRRILLLALALAVAPAAAAVDVPTVPMTDVHGPDPPSSGCRPMCFDGGLFVDGPDPPQDPCRPTCLADVGLGVASHGARLVLDVPLPCEPDCGPPQSPCQPMCWAPRP